MTDYYIYLWKTTWIISSGIILLSLFVVIRLIIKGIKIFAKKSPNWKKAFYVLKAFGWLGILLIYFYIFYLSEPDWFSRPQWIQGEVVSKNTTDGDKHPYTISVQTDGNPLELAVDEFTYRELALEQEVKISYSLHRLEVVTCEIILPD